MDEVLRPSSRVVVSVLVFLAGFVLLLLYFTNRNENYVPLFIFLPLPLIMAVLVLIGRRSWMSLGESSIQQSNPFTKRMTWRLDAEQIEDWSEVGYGEAWWLTQEPDDREVYGDKPDPAGRWERRNRYILFRLAGSGEILQIDMTYSTGRHLEKVRQWFERNVGPPLEGNNQLHWFIEKKRDKRCYLKRAIPDAATIP
ncbi:MAG: hypothetical protein R3C45_20960 [Phycisphaerales bacterium]